MTIPQDRGRRGNYFLYNKQGARSAAEYLRIGWVFLSELTCRSNAKGRIRTYVVGGCLGGVVR